MARPWDADVDVTAALAARLIDSQFPDLAPARVEPLAVGWDNAAFRVNGIWVFRLPRRQLGAECMAAELSWLPTIAAALSVPVSAAERIGRPEGDYPYPFGGYRRIDGLTGDRVPDADPAAADVGRFLHGLHRLPVPEEAPGDAFQRSHMPRKLDRLQEQADRVIGRGRDLAPVLSRMRELSASPAWTRPRVWLHGDLYARHLVFGTDGRLAGVIDWGDIHAGDPALDLSIAFSLFAGPARKRLLAAYGPADEATLDRARFRALHYGVILLDYGQETGDAALAGTGALALERGLL